MPSIQHRNAVVTGAAGDIGFAIAERLCRDGHDVTLVDVQDKVIQAAESISRAGYKAQHKIVDICDEGSVQSFFAELSSSGRDAGILVNNAGISVKHNGLSRRLEETPLDEWERVIRINLIGTFLMCRGVVAGMRQQKWGRIINIASLAGRTRSLVSGSHYAASKAGMLGLARTLAGEVASDGITVNSVAPALIDAGLAKAVSGNLTEQYVARIPVGRIGKPEEVAALVSFIASEETGFMTGAIFDINGGVFMA